MRASPSSRPRWTGGRARIPIAMAALLAALLAGCDEDQVVDPGTPNSGNLELGFGEYRKIESGGPVIGFQRVVQDSRCPTQVVCVWQGEGIVRLALVPPLADTTFLELSTQGAQQEGQALGYTIKVEKLLPYPQVPGAIPENQYRVVLTARRS